MITAPGIYPEIEADDHFADPTPLPSLRQSLIGDLLDRSAWHAAYSHRRLNPYGKADDSTRAAFIGSAVHRLALRKGQEISIIKYPDYRSATAREKRDEAVRNKRIPVLERDYLHSVDMADLVREAITDATEGHPYMTEVPFYWLEQTPFGPCWCGGMVDVWCPALRLILDPKTSARPAVPASFGSEAQQNGYDVQAAFYPRGFGQIFPDLAGRIRFANLVVEKSEPAGIAILAPDESSRYIAERRCERAIHLWARCLAERSFPGYPRGVQSYSTPTWYQNAVMAAELEE